MVQYVIIYIAFDNFTMKQSHKVFHGKFVLDLKIRQKRLKMEFFSVLLILEMNITSFPLIFAEDLKFYLLFPLLPSSIGACVCMRIMCVEIHKNISSAVFHFHR